MTRCYILYGVLYFAIPNNTYDAFVTVIPNFSSAPYAWIVAYRHSIFLHQLDIYILTTYSKYPNLTTLVLVKQVNRLINFNLKSKTYRSEVIAELFQRTYFRDALTIGSLGFLMIAKSLTNVQNVLILYFANDFNMTADTYSLWLRGSLPNYLRNSFLQDILKGCFGLD